MHSHTHTYTVHTYVLCQQGAQMSVNMRPNDGAELLNNRTIAPRVQPITARGLAGLEAANPISSSIRNTEG